MIDRIAALLQSWLIEADAVQQSVTFNGHGQVRARALRECAVALSEVITEADPATLRTDADRLEALRPKEGA